MVVEKRRNGFYIGAVIGFFGCFIQATNGTNPNDIDILRLLMECVGISVVTGVLFLLGISALSGRGQADNINSQKYDGEVRAITNKEVATKNQKPSKHK